MEIKEMKRAIFPKKSLKGLAKLYVKNIVNALYVSVKL